MISDFNGKTAVVTGAGSGLGREFARIAAQRGMNLVLIDIEEAALASATRELASRGSGVDSFLLDVSDAGQMEAMGQAVFERFGAPHLVLNNAGVGSGGLIWESTVRDWEWVLGVNLMGVVHGVRIFTPMMLAAAQKHPDWRGHIVNTASMAGLLSTPNMGVYNVSKHAVVALSETLYQDLALVTSQIGASVLCPFFVPTNIARSHRNRPKTPEGESQTRSQLIERSMIGRAVDAGRVSAVQVAQMVFDAVAANRFYVYSHPKAMQSVQTRMEDIISARNPTSPFADKPEIGEELKNALRAR
jgi:NAD(P)-dependent dehydrogenase (short-subunit alcohol dehydrogenase family)